MKKIFTSWAQAYTLNDRYLVSILIFHLFLLPVMLYSQTDYLEIIPPSPNSSELGKYVETPVDYFTGIPNISIPLYTIKCKSLDIPISLNYHGGGIKVEQTSTWVGLGWSLSSGGLITRVVRGLPDDRYHTDNFISKGFYFFTGAYDGLLSNNNTINAYNSYLVSNGIADGEPDMFFFNFMGINGQFFFDNDKHIHLTSQNDILIQPTIENYSITKFIITLANGTKYIFDQIESTFSNLPYDLEFNSSWYLSEIITQTESILFFYEDEEISEQKLNGQTSWVDTDGITHNLFRKRYDPLIQSKCKRLSRIEWSNGYIVFNADQLREDLGHFPNSTKYAKALTNIEIFNNLDQLIKEYNFTYSYYNSSGCSLDPDEIYLCKRLKLNSLIENENPPYLFEYDNTLMPPRNSFSQDFWGYYNGILNTTLIPDLWAYPTDGQNPLYLSIYSIFQRNSFSGMEYFLDIGADRNPNPQKMQVGILKRIKYPTGGYLQLEYQANEFYFDGEVRIGPGLRISKTKLSSELSNHIIEKDYSYDEFTNTSITSGRIYSIPQFAHRKIDYVRDLITLEDILKGTFLDVSPIGGFGESQGSLIGYKNITVIQPGNGKTEFTYDLPGTAEVTQDNCESGECIYNRTLSETTYGIYLCWPNQPFGIPVNYYMPAPSTKDYYPFGPNPNYDWNRGQLLIENNYDEEDLINPVKRIAYEYEIKGFEKIPGIKIMSMLSLPYTCPYSCITEYQGLNLPPPTDAYYQFYKKAKYDNLTGWKVLKSKKEYLFDRLDITKFTLSIQEFSHTSQQHHQLINERTYSSSGDTIDVTYRYPDEFLSNIVTKSMFLSYHQIDVPIETIKRKNNLVFSSSIIEPKCYNCSYDEGVLINGFVKPYRFIELETNQPISDYQIASSSLVADSRCNTKVTIDEYDNFGNVLQLKKPNDLLTSFIWGYNGSLVTAATQNASCNEIYFESFEDEKWLSDPYNPDKPARYLLDRHNGRYSLYVKNGQFGLSQIVDGLSRDRKYILSAWIKTEDGFDASNGNQANLIIQVIDKSNGQQLAWLTTWVTQTNGVWKRFERDIDLASFPQNVKLKIELWNSNNSKYLLADDVRFVPKDAEMTSFTYHPLLGITSVTDPNNISQLFEYDSFGRLKNVRNNDGAITSRNYYHYYNDTSSDTPYLNTSPTSMSFGSGSSSSSLSIISNTIWTITDNATWLSVNTTSGTGNATITVSATANTSAARNATITITYAGGLTKTVSVSQAAGSTSTLLVSPMTISFGYLASPVMVTISSNTSWTVTKSASWITISATSGTGNGTITVRGSKLLTGTRSGTVTIKTTNNAVTRIINVYQDSELIEL